MRKLTDEEFDTLTSIVSYAIFDECQSYNGIYTENFRIERNTTIDNWETCYVIDVNRRTAVSTHIDHISITLNDKAVELTDAQMDELNKVVNYTVEGSL